MLKVHSSSLLGCRTVTALIAALVLLLFSPAALQAGKKKKPPDHDEGRAQATG